MAKTKSAQRKPRLGAETVDQLNLDLSGLRALREKSSTGLGALIGLAKKVEEAAKASESQGEEAKGSLGDVINLQKATSKAPDLIKNSANFGRLGVAFAQRLERLVTTRSNGEPIEGRLVPFHWDRHKYHGDPGDLPGLYITGGVVSHSSGWPISGRVVDVGSFENGEIGAWVWEQGQKKWSNYDREGPQHIKLLDPEVVFLDFLPDCKLPQPEDYIHHAGVGDIMD